MCKKQTAVSHSSTEAEILSFDAGLRMEVLPAMVSEFVVDVLSNAGGLSWRTQSNAWRPHSIDRVPPNIQASNQRAQLFVLENKEAVI